jgi:hypothetical protein
MPASLLSAFEGKPLLDIRSLGRKGSGRRDHMTRTEVEIMRRTLNRDPEVMVKVISKGAQDLKAIEKHLKYIGREGDVDLLDDQGQAIRDPKAAQDIIEEWDLDIESNRRAFRLKATDKGKPPKLVHKLMFSMPPGTPPKKVLAAVQNFARDEFGLQHRYVMALHTDEPHPHVHVLVKAMSEQGVRLNIRKATLRMWRSEFARHLREQGVRANATDRFARGRLGRALSTEVYRGHERDALTKMTLRKNPTPVDPEIRLRLTRAIAEVRDGWTQVETQHGAVIRSSQERTPKDRPPLSR